MTQSYVSLILRVQMSEVYSPLGRLEAGMDTEIAIRIPGYGTFLKPTIPSDAVQDQDDLRCDRRIQGSWYAAIFSQANAAKMG